MGECVSLSSFLDIFNDFTKYKVLDTNIEKTIITD